MILKFSNRKAFAINKIFLRNFSCPVENRLMFSFMHPTINLEAIIATFPNSSLRHGCREGLDHERYSLQLVLSFSKVTCMSTMGGLP